MGRRFLCHSPPLPILDRNRIYVSHGSVWGSMESQKAPTIQNRPAVHRLRLGSIQQICLVTRREEVHHLSLDQALAFRQREVHNKGHPISPWKAGFRRVNFPLDSASPPLNNSLLAVLSQPPGKTSPLSSRTSRSEMDQFPSSRSTSFHAPFSSRPGRLGLVGRRQHLLWDWCGDRRSLGGLALGPSVSTGPLVHLQHRMGRSGDGRIRRSPPDPSGFTQPSEEPSLPGTIRQHGGCRDHQKGSLPINDLKRDTEGHLPPIGGSENIPSGSLRPEPQQSRRPPIEGGHPSFLASFLQGGSQGFSAASPPPPVEITVFMNIIPPSSPPLPVDIRPSPLRPHCSAHERIFEWKGVNAPIPRTSDDIWSFARETKTLYASTKDFSAYGSGLKKFHIFCDIFSISESDRLPASFQTIHSFVLWASADESDAALPGAPTLPSEPVSDSTLRHYLSAIRAWHIAQGWLPPLNEAQRDRINLSLKGIANLQAAHHRKPPRPPVTTAMLYLLKDSLNLSAPFDACVWAIATCAFWAMLRLGEATVKSNRAFNPLSCLTRKDATEDLDLDKRLFARLNLPSAKTARPGESQSVVIIPQGNLCPIEALRNLAIVVPAKADDPMFSWRDDKGAIRPMAKPRFMERVNGILTSNNSDRIFGHSFRIGGASYYMANKIDTEVVRIAGRWRSLAYQTYVRGVEQAISRRFADLPKA